MNFTLFKARVMPAVIAADEERRKVLAGEDLIFKDLDPEDTKTRSRKKNFASDLFLAPNPKNLYPVFQMFQKSENFTLAELKNALIRLADLDYQFKTSASQERTGIENFIIALCGQIDQGEA